MNTEPPFQQATSRMDENLPPPVRTSHGHLFKFTGPHGTFIIKKSLIQGVRIQHLPSGQTEVRLFLPQGGESVYPEYLDDILRILMGDSDQYE
jgi:hypothetical protein